MRYLFGRIRRRPVWNGAIFSLTLTVVIGMSYLVSADYLNQSTESTPVETSNDYTCSNADCNGGGCPGRNNTADCEGCHTDRCCDDGCQGNDCDTCDCSNTFCSNHTGSKDYECGSSGE